MVLKALIFALSVAEGRRISTSPSQTQVANDDHGEAIASLLNMENPASGFNLGSSSVPRSRGDVTYNFAGGARAQPVPTMGLFGGKGTGLVWPSPEAEKKVRKEGGITMYPTHAWADGMKPIGKAKSTMLSTPYIVGVAADSGCGKSTFLSRIMSALGTKVKPGHTAIGDQMTVVCLDDYHINDRAGRKSTGLTALDAKENDFALMGAQIEALKNKQAINKPIYNHDTGFKDEPERIEPNDLMIFEGLHPIYDDKAREQLDLSIYIDIVNEVKFEWKVQRDVKERGWTEDQVREDIQKRLPDFSEYVDPQKMNADIILRYEPSDKGLPGLKVKLIQPGAVRSHPLTKHPGYKQKFQVVQLMKDLELKSATIKGYIEPWGDFPFAQVIEMDGVLDKDNMAAELRMIEDNLAGLQTESVSELTDSMVALKDSPGSLDGTGLFQNVIALQTRAAFQTSFETTFKSSAKRCGFEFPLAGAGEKPIWEDVDGMAKVDRAVEIMRTMMDEKRISRELEARKKDEAEAAKAR